ncbi:MAG: caspase family protein [Pseudomonadota bacterium]
MQLPLSLSRLAPAPAAALCALAALTCLGALAQDGRSLPARGNRHALIIGVSQYADPATPPLPGARIDRESATQMARAMQVPPSNITYLQDEQATGNNIRRALAELNARVEDGDRVFIHYSGHGTRYNDPAAGGCVEALLAYDGGQSGTITNRQVADLLKPITAKTDKLFVMYDACHSGGLVRDMPEVRTRGFTLATGEGTLRPKFSSISEECGQPVNVKTRNLVVEAVAQGGLPQDIIHLSASRDNEVSFDDSNKGGLATQFMRDCMLREAKDLDNSGAITMDEIRICAQEKINKRMQGDRLFKPHNITMTGNTGFVPAWFNQALPQQVMAAINATTAAVTAISNVGRPQAAPPSPAPAMPVAAPAAAAAPAPVAAAAPAAPAAAPAAPPPQLTGAEALRQMHDQRDAKRRVQAFLGKPQLKIGQDALDITVQSDRAGYVYLALAGSDNKSVYLLFPNDLDKANRIEAGQRMVLPRPHWRVRAGGPAGTNNLLVVVADGPRDLGTLQAGKAGPFVASLNDAEGRARLGALMTTARDSAAGQCGSPAARRNNPLCSDAFGATMLAVEEVR